jgi:2'-5' RNA ligase
MPRLFIAIDLPKEIKKAIHGLCSGLPGARWTPDDQLHLTLRFLGEVEQSLFAELYSRLDEIRGEAFPLHLTGLGVFPNTTAPRVLWVGLDKSDPLVELRTRVDSVVRDLNIPLEKKKFSPHITIARLDKPPGPRLGTYLAANNLFRPPPFQADSFRLYSSILRLDGAVHTCEAEYFLDKTSTPSVQS